MTHTCSPSSASPDLTSVHPKRFPRGRSARRQASCSLLAFLLLACLAFSAPQAPAAPVRIADLWYELSPDEGCAAVCAPPDAPYSLSKAMVPETVTDEEGVSFRVTKIGPFAFGKSSIRSVSVPGSVLTVGKEAFAGCASLAELRFEKGADPLAIQDFIFDSKADAARIADMAEMTFYCGRELRIEPNKFLLKYANAVSCLIEGVRAVDGKYLADCRTLKRAEFLGGLEELGPVAFANCKALEVLILSEGLKSMVTGVFDNCTSLREVRLPSTLENLEIFYDSDNLRDIYCSRNEPPTLLSKTALRPYNDLSQGVVHVKKDCVDAFSPWASDRFRIAGDLPDDEPEAVRRVTLCLQGEGTVALESDGVEIGRATPRDPEIPVFIATGPTSLTAVATPAPDMDVAALRAVGADGSPLSAECAVRGRSLTCAVPADKVDRIEAHFTIGDAHTLRILLPRTGSEMTLSLPQGSPYRFSYTSSDNHRVQSVTLEEEELPILRADDTRVTIEIPPYEGERTLRILEEESGASISGPHAETSSMRLRATNGHIELHGLADTERVSVFAPDGTLLFAGTADRGVLTLPRTLRGICLIRTSSSSLKTNL